jgi:hypothetical protein
MLAMPAATPGHLQREGDRRAGAALAATLPDSAQDSVRAARRRGTAQVGQDPPEPVDPVLGRIAAGGAEGLRPEGLRPAQRVGHAVRHEDEAVTWPEQQQRVVQPRIWAYPQRGADPPDRRDRAVLPVHERGRGARRAYPNARAENGRPHGCVDRREESSVKY